MDDPVRQRHRPTETPIVVIGDDVDMFAQIYICPIHGETWHIQQAEEIDTDNDEVYQFMACDKCGSEVKPLLHDGHQVVHPLTDEEMFFEMQSFEDEDAG